MPPTRSPHTFRLFLAAALAFLAVVATAGAQEYDPKGSLTFATNADPTLNPWNASAVIESNLINTILFDQLVRYDPTDLHPAPGLAESWEVAADGLSWTFHLRPEATWSDGVPFTAADVAFTFNEAVLKKELGARNSSAFSPVERVVAVDDHTAVFELKRPSSSLPYYLAYYAGIIPAHVLGGAENPLTVASFNKANPVVTGPYRVGEFVAGAYVKLVPNENYWGPAPKLASITFNIIPDGNAQVAQLLAGGLDMVSITNPALLAGVASNPNLEVIRQSQNIWYFVALNLNDARFQDARVRQALLSAIDRQAIIDAVLEGYGVVATGPIAPLQQALYDPEVAKWPYDPERAKALFAEAGWTPGPDGVLQKDGERMTIDMPTGQYGYLVPSTLLVQQYWQDVGVDVKVETIEWNAFIQKAVVNRDYDAMLAWWSTPPTPDQSGYFESSAAVTGNNIPDYRNPELDAIWERGRAATTVEEQVKVYREAQELIARELPYLFLWYPDMIAVKNTRIGGMYDINSAANFQYSFNWFVKP